MSARTDLVRKPFEQGFDAERDRATITDDAILYAPGVGPEVHGGDAAIEALSKFWAEHNPKYRIVREPIEQGNFVVVFVEADVGGRTVEVANLYRFDGDKVNGLWAIRG